MIDEQATPVVELVEIAQELEQLLPRVEKLRRRRLELWKEGRGLGFTSAVLARASRVEAVTVRRATGPLA